MENYRNSIDYLVYIPIIIFSLLSFSTTAMGVRIFFPENWPYFSDYIFSFLISGAIQSMLVYCALKIYESGLRKKFVIIYLIPGIISITFSYTGLFQFTSGGFINKNMREDFYKNFKEYSNNLNDYITKSIRLVSESKEVMSKIKQQEKNVGFTFKSLQTDPYIWFLCKDSIDKVVEEARLGSGEGPIYNYFLSIETKLIQREETLKFYKSNIEKLNTQDISATDPINLIDDAKQLDKSIDWDLIEEVLQVNNKSFSIPIIPSIKLLGGNKDDKTRLKKLLWTYEAIQAIWKNFDWVTIGAPILMAIALDLLVFIIALIFREPSNKEHDSDILQEKLIKILETLRASNEQKRAAMDGIITGLMAGKNSSYYLNHNYFKEIGLWPKALISIMYNHKLIKRNRLTKRFIFPKDFYEICRNISVSYNS